MTPVRVLVVDDSATMRGLISASLRRDPEIDVVGTASDPLEARTAIKALNPDVITLDIEMPNMSGLDFLEKIMRLRPMPVVMVSTLTTSGAEETLRALEIGAIDCVAKPVAGDRTEGMNDLAAKVKIAARARVRFAQAPPAPVASDYVPNNAIVGIGSSTGGVEALLTVIAAYPARCPATVITQHMPANFTASLAARLDRASEASVAEAYDGAPIEPGRVWLAPGGACHLTVASAGAGRAICRLQAADPVNGHRPSVDMLFHSVAKLRGAETVGAILTGMGRDGADGLLSIRAGGGRTIGQDADSCVVYGMPRVAQEIGAVERQYPLAAIGPAILDLCRARA